MPAVIHFCKKSYNSVPVIEWQMVGHEITGFDTRSCRNKTTAREGATLHRQGCAMLGIYQRTRVVKTVARGIRRRELGTYLKDTYNSGKYKTMGTT